MSTDGTLDMRALLRDGEAVLLVRGPLVRTTAPAALAVAREALGYRAPSLCLDLRRVTRIDASGLVVLERILLAAAEIGSAARMVCERGQVRNAVESVSLGASVEVVVGEATP